MKIKGPLQRMTKVEWKALAALLILKLIILPFVPRTPIDPWGIINPHTSVNLIFVLALIQVLGYFGHRVIGPFFGHSAGTLVSNFFSGFASSTAVYLTSPRKPMATQHPRLTTRAVILALTGSFIQLWILLRVVAPSISTEMTWDLVLIIGGGIAWVFLSKKHSKPDHTVLAPPRPLVWTQVFQMAGILIFFTAAISVTRRFLGDQASTALAFLSGFFELHGLSLANSSLFQSGSLTLSQAASGIRWGIYGSLSSKILITVFFGRGHYRRLTLISTTLILILALLARNDIQSALLAFAGIHPPN